MAITLNGDGLIQVDGTSTTQGRVRLNEDSDNGTNYVELQAAASLAANVTFTLPDADGTNGQVIQTNGSGALSFTTISGGGDYIMQVFSTPGTWTKPVGLKAIKVTVIGGGGGAAGDTGSNGGGGGTSIEYIDAPAIPGPQPYTVGTGGAGGPGPGPVRTGSTGGTSSFGGPVAFLSATGGSGGVYVTPGDSNVSGGAGSNGQLNFNGSPGMNFAGTQSTINAGGGTFLAGNRFATPSPGATLGYGGGAGGTNPTSPGLSGGAGVVIVEEFY